MTSITDAKLELLDAICETFDSFVEKEYKMACSRQCAACCTYDIAATTLEASRMLKALKSLNREDLIEKLDVVAGQDIFRPRITTNTLAMACMTRQEPPIEEPGANPGACPFLENEACTAYDARPFSCRGMFSLVKCAPGSEAEIPPELVSIVTTCWQIIEHLDVGGLYGNLIDLMQGLNSRNNSFKYDTGEKLVLKKLPPTRPVPGFLIPQEHEKAVQGFLDQLMNRDCGGRTFRERMAEVRNSPF